MLPVQGEYLRLPEGAYGTVKRNSAYQIGPVLKGQIQRLMQEIGYTGVFEMEFMRNAEMDLYFLEINFRHTQYNHALTDMGVNLSDIWMKGMMGETCNLDDWVVNDAVVINESRDFRYFVKTGQISLFKWLKDLFKANSYYMLDKKDWMFCLRFIGKSVWMQVSSIVKRPSKASGGGIS